MEMGGEIQGCGSEWGEGRTSMTLGILGKLESRVSFRDRYILHANQEASNASMEQTESNESIYTTSR